MVEIKNDSEQDFLALLNDAYATQAKEACALLEKISKGEPVSEERLEEQKQRKKQIDVLKSSYLGIKQIQKASGKKNNNAFIELHEKLAGIQTNQGSVVGDITENNKL